LGAVELTSNRRQNEGWERAALDELRSGDVGIALSTYDEAGHIHVAPSASDARSVLVSDGCSHGQPARTLGCTQRAATTSTG
jgi:AAA domain